MSPSIILVGATGRTGNAVAHELARRRDGLLVACVAPSVATSATRPLPEGVPAFATLREALNATSATVVVDLSQAAAALAHARETLEHGRHFVIGVTGLHDEDIQELGRAFADADRGLFVVPNFSIAAVIGMQVVAQIARHMADVEIIETHHDGKLDAPSGTAIHTAKLIAQARRASGLEPSTAAQDAGKHVSRGESIDGVPVHAVRLAGATAHQEVVFGAPGELLTVRHDAIDRSCYAAGVVLAATYILTTRGLQIGLEHAL